MVVETAYLVVVDEEQDRQIVQRGEIEGFGHRTLMDRAIAEKGDDHVAVARALARPCDSGGDGDAAADDRVRADDPRLAPAQMHRAAAAAAPALFQTHDLRQRALENVLHRRRQIVAPRIEAFRLDVVERLGEKMVVGAVRAVDLIVRAQRADAGDGGALLADRRMGGPVHEVLVDEREHVFLEGADQVQVVQRAHQPGPISIPPVGCGRPHLPPRRLGMQGVHVGHGGLPRSAAGP